MDIKVGNKFRAIIRKGPFSKTLGGQEAFGKVLGPLKCTKIVGGTVQSKDMIFMPSRFVLRRVVK